MSESMKYSESSARVWELVSNLTVLYERENHEWDGPDRPNIDIVCNMEGIILSILDEYSEEISDYSLEELMNVMLSLQDDTIHDTLVATRPLMCRTIMEAKKKAKSLDDGKAMSIGSR